MQFSLKAAAVNAEAMESSLPSLSATASAAFVALVPRLEYLLNTITQIASLHPFASHPGLAQLPVLPVHNGRVIARGGFGIVCSGMWHRELVAVKHFLSHRSTCTEFHVAVRVRSPYVAPCVGTTAAGALIMPLCDAGTLREWLRVHSITSHACVRIRLSLAAQLCRAVAAVHAVGYVHCDLKPSNVLLRPDSTDKRPRVWLTDFGNACKLGTVVSCSGTPGFIAPELLVGRARRVPVQAHCDVWSLGVLLLHLFVPFRGLQPVMPPTPGTETKRELRHKNLRSWSRSGAYPAFSNAQLPAVSIAAVLRACVARDPSTRPTCAQLCDFFRMQGILPAVPNWASRFIDASSPAPTDPLSRLGRRRPPGMPPPPEDDEA